MAPPPHAMCLLKCWRGSPAPRHWVSLLQGDVSSFVRMCRCGRSFIRGRGCVSGVRVIEPRGTFASQKCGDQYANKENCAMFFTFSQL
ncbi:hypothetical protein EE612_058536 [Oryza sativa]|nr:hypothetical protein EE612_058536 [Oryza sativa]